MARVAVLADIHGNLPALEAVIRDLEQQGVDEVVLGGDLVGRGPQGSAVLAVARDRGWRSIRGNHEDYLLAFRHTDVPESWLTARVWSAARWMAAELSEQDVRQMESMPPSLRPRSMPQVRLVHGTPQSNNDGIGPWTSTRHVQRHFDSVEESVLVCAHTHRPLEHRLEGGAVLNTGSVGLPFNRDRRAQYLVLEERGDEIAAEFRQVEYDLEAIYRLYEQTGFLAAGGATAQLLLLELKHAAPYLVPFLAWTRSEGRDQEVEQIEPFLASYDPERQREFFGSLRRREKPAT
jgi:predicted phosphodiesterase